MGQFIVPKKKSSYLKHGGADRAALPQRAGGVRDLALCEIAALQLHFSKKSDVVVKVEQCVESAKFRSATQRRTASQGPRCNDMLKHLCGEGSCI